MENELVGCQVRDELSFDSTLLGFKRHVFHWPVNFVWVVHSLVTHPYPYLRVSIYMHRCPNYSDAAGCPAGGESKVR